MTLDSSLRFAGSHAPNCGVTAIATITNTSFDKVWEIMQMNKSKNWKGVTDLDDRARALAILGFEEVIIPYRGNFDLECFVRHLANPEVACLVYTNNHVQVVHLNRVTDQRGTLPVEKAFARNKRVERVATIRPLKATTSALDSFLNNF